MSALKKDNQAIRILVVDFVIWRNIGRLVEKFMAVGKACIYCRDQLVSSIVVETMKRRIGYPPRPVLQC